MKFSFANPSRIVFGQGQIAALAGLVPAGARVLLMYGGGSIKRNGVWEQVRAALGERVVVEFAGVEVNPDVSTLDRAVALAKAEGLDYVLAVGGGSVIDGAKYVAAAACYDGEGWDILTHRHVPQAALPLGVVLTLAATGSESNVNSVVSRRATGEKLAFASEHVYPRFAVLDPSVLASLPDRQLVNGLADAFVHVCEQYLTRPGQTPVQTGYAEVPLNTLHDLAQRFDMRREPEWLESLMWSANQALNGLIGQGVVQDWATHRIGHEFTARYGLDHARTLTLVQPALLRETLPEKQARLERMGARVFGLTGEGEQLARGTIVALEAFYRALGLPVCLRDTDIEDVDCASHILEALKQHNMLPLGESGCIDAERAARILADACR